jgi:hypothetical protein
MTDSEYEDAGGSESAVGDGTVVWSRFKILTVGARGFMGVAGRECLRYHAKTGHMVNDGSITCGSILRLAYSCDRTC